MEVTVVYKPQRQLLIKRGKKAEDYFAYCEEVGCDVWDELLAMATEEEPVSLWLPDHLMPEGTSRYAQGVEVPDDFQGDIPQGFELIKLPSSTYLKFHDTPFEDENYAEAIDSLRQKMAKFDPTDMNYEWDDEVPRVQLEPKGERGYIEMRGIKPRNHL